MAVQETRALPAPFIKGLGEDYAGELKSLYQKPIDTKMFQPKVADQHKLQTDARMIYCVKRNTKLSAALTSEAA